MRIQKKELNVCSIASYSCCLVSFAFFSNHCKVASFKISFNFYDVKLIISWIVAPYKSSHVIFLFCVI